MFTGLKLKRFGGASGTVTLPAGAQIIHMTIHATSAGSVAFADGAGGTVTVPIPASSQWFDYDPKHINTVMGAGGSPVTVVFTGTDSYFLEVANPTGW